MAQESERPAGVTEMHVRMDCNGCVNRIKKALHRVEGIYEVQVDFPQQKLTVIGRATPEKIVKAIKKTRKIATICSHTEAAAAAAAAAAGPGAPEQPPSESAPATADPPAPAADAADHQPAAEAPPAEAPAAPPAEQTQEPPTPEDAGAGDQVKPPAAATGLQPEGLPAEAKDVGEIHMIHHQYYPHHHHHRALYQDHWAGYRHPYGYGGHHEAPFSPVIHSYHSRYTPATHISEYGYLQPTPQSIRYSSSSSIVAAEPYSDDDFYRSSRSTEGSSNTITSMFSDENPNACTIV